MLVQTNTLGEKDDSFIEAIYESSNILMSTYFPNANKLYIHFSRGGTYSYTNIDENMYKDFENADSQGKYFIANIKKFSNKYPFSKEYVLNESEIRNAKQIIKEHHERN